MPTKEEVREGLNINDRAIMEGVYEPIIHATVDDEGKPVRLPGKLHIGHLALDDYLALSEEVFTRMGASAREGAALRSFRQDEERGIDPSPGAGVSDATASVFAPESLGIDVRRADHLAGRDGQGQSPEDDEPPQQG
jgi:hypothetical protein